MRTEEANNARCLLRNQRYMRGIAKHLLATAGGLPDRALLAAHFRCGVMDAVAQALAEGWEYEPHLYGPKLPNTDFGPVEWVGAWLPPGSQFIGYTGPHHDRLAIPQYPSFKETDDE